MKSIKILLLFLLILILPGIGLGEWYVFSPDEIPKALSETSMLVGGACGEVTLTFLGDCTLGGEKNSRNFERTISQKGIDWCFGGVSELLQNDTVTLVNLEGVLSDRKLTAAHKKFCFKGKTSYTDILKAGSVECVTLCNNHSHDYGKKGLSDTKEALDAAGIAYVNDDTLMVYDDEEIGLRIGFTASVFYLGASGEERLRVQVELLRQIGCDLIIHSMHGGREYDDEPNAAQKETARLMAELGVDVVVGHHPHIVQGFEWIGNTLVLYSLGNAVFGGNANPRDKDALLVQVCFIFDEDVKTNMTLHLYPISVSSQKRGNDYRLTLLEGEAAERVLQKMKDSTGSDPFTYGQVSPVEN